MSTPASPQGYDPVDDGVRIAFAHPFFSAVPDGYFRLSEHTKAPVFVISLEGVDTALSLPGIRNEFRIADDGPDAQMLELVAKGLNFVKALRLGDPVPREVLTGEASWDVEPRHLEIALQRLRMQLVGWHLGNEVAIVEESALQQVADDPAARARLEAAAAAAAAQLDLDATAVLSMVSELAGEMAYVEALRGRLADVHAMRDKIGASRHTVARDRSRAEGIDRVAKLLRTGLSELDRLFEQVDGQTCEIMAMLRNADAQRRFIRGMRDDLHARFVAWSDVLDGWRALDPEKPRPTPDLVDMTYRFLAARFMPATEWILSSKSLGPRPGAAGTSLLQGQPAPAAGNRLKTAVTW